jgi:hypothetical protein
MAKDWKGKGAQDSDPRDADMADVLIRPDLGVAEGPKISQDPATQTAGPTADAGKSPWARLSKGWRRRRGG